MTQTPTAPALFDRPATDLPDLETHTTVYGVRLSEIGDDGDVFALGHVGKLRMIAALNWQARTVWGMELAEFVLRDAVDQIVHTWMRNVGGTGLSDWCLEPAQAGEAGAFPVTYWAP